MFESSFKLIMNRNVSVKCVVYFCKKIKNASDAALKEEVPPLSQNLQMIGGYF